MDIEHRFLTYFAFVLIFPLSSKAQDNVVLNNEEYHFEYSGTVVHDEFMIEKIDSTYVGHRALIIEDTQDCHLLILVTNSDEGLSDFIGDDFLYYLEEEGLQSLELDEGAKYGENTYNLYSGESLKGDRRITYAIPEGKLNNHMFQFWNYYEEGEECFARKKKMIRQILTTLASD